VWRAIYLSVGRRRYQAGAAEEQLAHNRARSVPRGLTLLFFTVASWCLVVLAARYGELMLSMIAQLAIAAPVKPLPPSF